MTEQQEYLSIDEAAKVLKWNRATLYKWVGLLNIRKYRFAHNKKTYLAVADVELIRQARETPWKVMSPEEEKNREVA